MWRASFSAFTAAKHPMNPTLVRSTDGESPACVHDVEIEPGGGEAGAACHDQMGDGGAIRCDVQCGDRLQRERQRLALEPGHAIAGGGEAAAPVEALAVEEVIARLGARFEEREPMLDVGQAHHAIEQSDRMLVRQRGAGEVDEFRVDVVRRNRGADPVEPGLGHALLVFLQWAAASVAALPDVGRRGLMPACRLNARRDRSPGRRIRARTRDGLLKAPFPPSWPGVSRPSVASPALAEMAGTGPAMTEVFAGLLIVIGGYGSTFPGFMMPSGSSAALIRRIAPVRRRRASPASCRASACRCRARPRSCRPARAPPRSRRP